MLDVNEIYSIYNNTHILEDDYYIGKLSEQSIKNSEYKIDNRYIDSPWSSWLRSPYASNSNGLLIRSVFYNGKIGDCSANIGNNGVRPAFYLNLMFAFVEGNGTLENPYRIECD